MKKILCLALVLMLALGSTAALAQDGIVYGWFSVNQEQAAPLMELPEGDLANALFAVINNMGFVAGMNDEGVMHCELTLKDEPIITLQAAQNEQGVNLLTDLIPSYVLSVPAEALNAVMGESGIEEEQMTALINFGMQYVALFQQQLMVQAEALNQALTTGLAPCDITLYEEHYDMQAQSFITKDMMAPFFADLAQLLQQNPDLMAMVGIDPEENMDAMEPVNELMPEEGWPVNMMVNTTTGASYLKAELSIEAEDILLVLEQTQNEVETGASLLFLPLSEFTDVDTAVDNIAGGSDGIFLELWSYANDGVDWLDCNMFVSGEYFGFVAGGYEDTEYDCFRAYIGLYYNTMDEELMSIELAYCPNETPTFDVLPSEGKAVINAAETTAEDEEALSVDIQSLGLMNLLVKMSQIMPEEVSVLLNAMMAQ